MKISNKFQPENSTWCPPLFFVVALLTVGALASAFASDVQSDKVFQGSVDKIVKGNSSGIDTSAFIIELENRITRKPGQDSWLEAAGMLHFQVGRFDQARRALLKLRKPTSNDDRLIALSLFEMKEYRKALVYFTRIQSLRDNRGDWEKFCQAMSIGGSKTEALKEWESYRERYGNSPATVASGGGKYDGLEFLVESYRRTKQKEKLMATLEALLKKSKGTTEEGKYLLELSGLYGETHIKAVELRAQYLKLHPEDFTAARGLAAMMEARGEVKKAIPLYLEIAPHFTADPKFNRHLASLLAKSDPDKALLFYEICRTLAPKDFEIPLAMAHLQEDLRRPELALEAYKAVLDLNPTQPEAKTRMVALASVSKVSGPWLQTMVENEKKNPKDHAYQFQLAKLFLAAQDKENAYKYLQKALLNSKDVEEYGQLLPQVITTDGQILKHFNLLQKMAAQPSASPQTLVMVGRGYSLYKNPTRAAETYAKVLGINSKLLEGHRPPILDLFAAKNYTAAGQLAEKYILKDPKDVDIRRIQVTALSETNASPGSLRAAIQALIALEPYDDKWYFRLAELDLAAKDTAASLKHGNEWVKMHPEDKRALLFLEPLAAKVKDGEIYFNTLDRLARIEPANQNQYDLKMAYFFFETGKYAQAAEALTKISNAYANDARFWNRLGISQFKLGRDNAKSSLEKAFRMEPTNPEFARGFGSVLETDGELKTNLDVFQILHRASPDKNEKRKLAHALFLNGNYGSSAQEWDWFLANDPAMTIEDSTAGMAFLKAGQIPKAKTILEKRLAANPRDVGLLATLSDLYGKEGDSKRRINAMERLVQEDQGVGDFVLRLAREKEKAGLSAEAISFYSQWVFRHQDDFSALKSYRELAEKQKDTTALIEALRHLTQANDADRLYRFQIAEIYFARSGELKELENLVAANPDYREGRRILIHEYHAKRSWEPLAAFEPFMAAEATGHSEFLEPLADLYAHQKKLTEAHQTYYTWLAVNRKDRNVFDKVYDYAKENKSPNLLAILKLGIESFPQDLGLLADYGTAQGNTPSALEAYQTILAKNSGDADIVAKAAEVAKMLGDRRAEAKWANRWSHLKPNEEKPWRYLIESLNPASDKKPLTEAMEGLLRLVPGNSELILSVAKLYEELGQWDKAIGHYRNALYLTPKDHAIRDRLITLMKEKGKKDELGDVLTEIQNIDSSAHEAQFELAKLYLQKEDKTKAYAYLSVALEQSPLNQNYQRLLPKVIHNREQIQKHLKLLQEIASRSETSKSDAGNTDLFLLLGQGYAFQGQWDNAATNFSTAYHLAPKRLVGDRDALIACYRGKNYALTAELTEKFFEKTQDFDKEIRQIQILCFEKSMKDPAAIRKALQLLLAVDQDNAGGQLRLAELDLRARDTAAAITNIRNCLTTSPNEIRGYKMLLPLISMAKSEQRVTYVVVLEKLVQLDSAKKSDYQIQLADFYFKRKAYRQTARLLSEVTEARPKDAESWYRLGACRIQLQTGDQGLSSFHQAYELQPSNLVFAHTYAQALQTPEDFKNNLKLYKFVEDRNPSPHERYGLAMAYFYTGETMASAKSWDRAMSDKQLEGKFVPEAALAYLRTSQPGKALPLYKIRLEHEANNLGLLDTVCEIYSKIGDEKGRVNTLEALVRVDATYKDFQLQFAKAKEKLRDTAVAIDNFGQWTARNEKDLEALKSMHRLAQAKADTASLENALHLLVRIANVGPEYSYQLAELQFKFTGETNDLERLVKAHPEYHHGKVILAKEFFRRYNIPKLIPYEKALAEEAVKEPELYGSLAELLAYQNKKALANRAFRDYLVYRKSQAKGETGLLDLRQAFDKAWLYSEANKSTFLVEVLEIGNNSFPGEQPIQLALALAVGKDSRALELYKQILNKDPNNLSALQRGSELAVTLGSQTESVTWLERWVSIEPGSTRAWQLLADASSLLKDYPKTADALDHLNLLSAPDAALAFRTGKAYLDAKNREKALEYLIRADELKPKDRAYAFEVQDLLQVMTEAFLNQGQISKAVELYGLVLVRDPKNQKANFYMGMWLAENHDFTSAIPMLKLGIEKSSESKIVLAKAWRLLGDCHSGHAEFKPALEAYKRALTLNPLDKAASISRLDMTHALNLDLEVPAALADVVKLDSANLDAAQELAEIRYKEGDFATAANLYKRVTLVRDKEPEAWGHYGEALEGIKRYPDAMAAWDKAYSLGDRTPYTLQGLARLHREGGTLASAEKALEDLVVLQPDNDEASAWLGELALSQGHLEKAEEMFTQAAQDAPDKIEYTQGMAEIYLRRGDGESAQEILQPVRGRLTLDGRVTLADALRLIGKPELSMPLYQEAFQMKPSVRALTGLADALLDRNKPAEAKRLIETSKLQGEPEVKHRLAKAFLALRDREKAAEILQGLVNANKANPNYLLTLAQVHYAQKNLTQALKEFREVLQMRADLAPAAFHIGLIQLSMGHVNEGRGFFFALAQNVAKPNRTLGLRGLAAASDAEKNPSEASDYLVQAAEVFPTPEVLADLSEISLRLGRIPDAEKWAQKSLEVDEDFAPGIVALSEVMIVQGHKDEARDYLKEALTRNPTSCEVRLEYSKVLVAMENFQGVSSSNHEALSLCPDEPLSYYYAGLSADKAYQKKQAEEFFRSYKKLGGDKNALPKGY